jgi:hypothetical protein
MMRFYFSITWCDPSAGKVRVMNVSTADEATGSRGPQAEQRGFEGEGAPLEAEGSRRPVRSGGKRRAGKVAAAFLFGTVWFIVLFAACEVVAPAVALCVGALGFFVCQYLLSRGNPQAGRTDWGMVVAMNGLPLGLLASALVVNLGAHLGQGADILKGLAGVVLSLGCSYAGAVVAARTARG